MSENGQRGKRKRAPGGGASPCGFRQSWRRRERWKGRKLKGERPTLAGVSARAHRREVSSVSSSSSHLSSPLSQSCSPLNPPQLASLPVAESSSTAAAKHAHHELGHETHQAVVLVNDHPSHTIGLKGLPIEVSDVCGQRKVSKNERETAKRRRTRDDEARSVR